MQAGATSEATPLLWQEGRDNSQSRSQLPYYHSDEVETTALRHKDVSGNTAHMQFCTLTGCPPSNWKGKEKWRVSNKTLYGRTTEQLHSQRLAYNFSATLNNVLLLSQVVLGAALTALGASASSHLLITIFGATQTIIAGLVAYLKSRGQPMRAKMYRDDLERLVDDIENSEILWRGISEGAHGYNDVDTEEVTVRSEVARLTRLYDRAIRLNDQNSPDSYSAGLDATDSGRGGGRQSKRAGTAAAPGGFPNMMLMADAPVLPQPSGQDSGPAAPADADAEDDSPASKSASKDDKSRDQSKQESDKAAGKKPATDGASGNVDAAVASTSSKGPPAPPTPTTASPRPAQQPQQSNAPIAEDPDESPVTAARLKPKRTTSEKQYVDGGDGKRDSGAK